MAKGERLNVWALLVWARFSPRRMLFLLRTVWRLWRAERRRVRYERTIDGLIPVVVAVSPTMRCIYNCVGCYSRGRRSEDELTSTELDALFTEAEQLGVLVIVVTGGEPLLRDDMVDLMARHQRLLFIPITNGSLVTEEVALRLGQSGNVIPLVSIEGFETDTDERRQPGAHETAVRAFERLRDAGVCFGFAAMNTAANTSHLGADEFVDQMVGFGCAVGFYSEYIPCGPDPKADWALDDESRAAFRERVLDLRCRKPILLSQFPHDEYGKDNQCLGAGRASLHINAQGDVEPCPFMPMARENIRQGGLLAACKSGFMRAIREEPHLLKRRHYGCSLFEHRAELEVLAQKLGAHSNEKLEKRDTSCSTA